MGELDVYRPTPAMELDVQRSYAVACRDHVMKHHVVRMQGRAYVTVAGATQVASLMGYTCREVGCVFVPGTDHLAAHWLGTVEVVNSDGTVIGRGSAICSTAEKLWKNRDDFARRSMAVTRAAGKALRLCVGHVFAMLGDGVQATTAEEMPAESDAPRPDDRQQPVTDVRPPFGAHITQVEACKSKAGKPYWRVTVKEGPGATPQTYTSFRPVESNLVGEEFNVHLARSSKGDTFLDHLTYIPDGDG